MSKDDITQRENDLILEALHIAIEYEQGLVRSIFQQPTDLQEMKRLHMKCLEAQGRYFTPDPEDDLFMAQALYTAIKYQQQRSGEMKRLLMTRFPEKANAFTELDEKYREAWETGSNYKSHSLRDFALKHYTPPNLLDQDDEPATA